MTSKSDDGLANGRLSIMGSSGCSTKTDSQAPLGETLGSTRACFFGGPLGAEGACWCPSAFGIRSNVR